MGNCIIAMESATLARKGIRVLEASGITCTQVSIDPALTRRGCGFGIAVSCSAVDRARDVLRRRSIRHGELIGGA